LELLRGRDDHCVAPREVAQAKRIELEGQVSTVVHDRAAGLTRGDVFNRRDEALVGIHSLELPGDTEMDERTRSRDEVPSRALGARNPLRVDRVLSFYPESPPAHGIPVDDGPTVGQQSGGERRQGVHSDGDAVAGSRRATYRLNGP